VAAILATALAIPLATQLQHARFHDARRQLEGGERRAPRLRRGAWATALPGHGRQPRRRGIAAGGDAGNACARTFTAASFPAPPSASRPWTTPASCAILADAGQSRALARAWSDDKRVERPLTRANECRQPRCRARQRASLPLRLRHGEGAGPGGFGPAANQLTRRAAFVLVSPGPQRRAPSRARLRRRAQPGRGTRRSWRAKPRPRGSTTWSIGRPSTR
jgi:hypothetical protein